MKVTGLDQTPSNNKVTIGPYPCIIAEKGVGDLFLNCVTTDIGDSTDIWNQEIKLWVKDKAVSRCTAR